MEKECKDCDQLFDESKIYLGRCDQCRRDHQDEKVDNWIEEIEELEEELEEIENGRKY